MRALEEPTELVGVANDADRTNVTVDEVERIGAVAGDRMANEQAGRAVDSDDLRIRLRPAHLAPCRNVGLLISMPMNSRPSSRPSLGGSKNSSSHVCAQVPISQPEE